MILCYDQIGRNRWAVTRPNKAKIAEVSHRSGRWYISPEPGRRVSPGEYGVMGCFADLKGE